jgi:hypothetical protein
MKYIKNYNTLNESARDMEDYVKFIANQYDEKITRYFGSGSFGRAYLTKSSKVLKITTDENEVAIAYKLSKKPWTKYIINYYNVESLRDFCDENNISEGDEFVLLMDRVKPFTYEAKTDREEEILKDALNYYTNKIQYKTDYFENVVDDELFFDNFDRYVSYNDKNYTDKVKEKILEWRPNIIGLVKEWKKFRIDSTDFHHGNVGWCLTGDKRIVQFDLGGYLSDDYEEKLKKYLPRIKQFKWNQEEYDEWFDK